MNPVPITHAPITHAMILAAGSVSRPKMAGMYQSVSRQASASSLPSS